MKEIMTSVSECDGADMSESEGNNNMVIPCLLGAALFIVCILCMFILWQKISGRNKAEIKAETYTEIQETALSGAPDGSLSEVNTINKEDEISENAEAERAREEAVRQQYLTNLESLKDRVESSLQSMIKTKETIELASAAQPDNTAFKEELTGITNEITALTLKLETAQTQINELEKSINVMNNETVTVIQENISDIEQQISEVDNDILDIYTKISDLKTADAELQKKIDEVAASLKTSAEQNMTDVTNQFNDVNNKMQQNMTDVTNQFNNVNDKVQQIESGLLKYLYDADSNTLHLYTN